MFDKLRQIEERWGEFCSAAAPLLLWPLVARAQQPFPIDFVGFHEDGDAALVEHERLRRFRDAVAEADAEGAVDPHPQRADGAFFEVAQRSLPETTVNRPIFRRWSGVST